MEGENDDALRILWPPMVETSPLRRFRKSVSTMPRFLHRGIAGNMQPLVGGEVRMIRWVIVGFRRSPKNFFKKSSVGVSKIDDFCHLGVKGETEGMFPDDYALATTWPTMKNSLSRNFLKVFPLCLNLYIDGQQGIWSR